MSLPDVNSCSCSLSKVKATASPGVPTRTSLPLSFGCPSSLLYSVAFTVFYNHWANSRSRNPKVNAYGNSDYLQLWVLSLLSAGWRQTASCWDGRWFVRALMVLAPKDKHPGKPLHPTQMGTFVCHLLPSFLGLCAVPVSLPTSPNSGASSELMSHPLPCRCHGFMALIVWVFS